MGITGIQSMRPAGGGSSNDVGFFTKQGIYEQSSTQEHKLGSRLQLGDRVFRYANAGETLTPAELVQQALYAGATTTLQNTSAVTVAASAGASRIYVNAVTTAQAANLFADGYAAVWDATTAGTSWLFKIKGNSALATSGTTSYVDIYDVLPVALTTDDQVFLMTSPYKSLIQSAASATGAAMGIVPVAVTSAYYFWLQTWGPAAVNPEDALVSNDAVVRSDGTAGQVCKMTSNTVGQIIGYCLHTGTADEAAIVFLTLAP